MSCYTLRPAGKYVVLFWTPHGDKYRYVCIVILRLFPLSASPHRQPSHPRTGSVYSGRHCLASPRLHACLSQDPHRATVLGAGGEGRLSREKTQARIPAPGHPFQSLYSRLGCRILSALLGSHSGSPKLLWCMPTLYSLQQGTPFPLPLNIVWRQPSVCCVLADVRSKNKVITHRRGGGGRDQARGAQGPRNPKSRQQAQRSRRAEDGGEGEEQLGVSGHCFVPFCASLWLLAGIIQGRLPSAADPFLVGLRCFVCCWLVVGVPDPFGFAALPLQLIC